MTPPQDAAASTECSWCGYELPAHDGDCPRKPYDAALKREPFADVYPCRGRCPYGVRCASGCCYEQEKIDAQRRCRCERPCVGPGIYPSCLDCGGRIGG